MDIENMQMNSRKPMVLVFAGPNGSGKSTIKQYFEVVGKYTNADDVVATTGMTNMDAAIFVDNQRYEAIKNLEDFSFETVLSSEYKIDILRKAKSEGYFIKAIFVLTSNPMMNVFRVRSRVASGGHDVDEKKIVERYYKSIDNIKVLFELCDILHVYDNTFSPYRIIRKHKDEVTLYENEFWKEDEIKKLIE